MNQGVHTNELQPKGVKHVAIEFVDGLLCVP
jgi:hypothetical protein